MKFLVSSNDNNSSLRNIRINCLKEMKHHSRPSSVQRLSTQSCVREMLMLSWEQVQIRCWDYPTDTLVSLVSLVSLDQCPAAVSMFQDSSPMLSTVSTPPTLPSHSSPPTLPSHSSPPTLLLRYRLWSKTLLLRTLWKVNTYQS